MLQSFKATGLFDRFNYNLSFTEEGIMIITGPNGYGKSTILRIINDLCNDSFEKVLSYPFKTLTIVCDNDNATLKITKNKNEFKINEYSFPYPKNDQSRDVYSLIMKRKTIYLVEELSKQWSLDDNEQKFVLSILLAFGESTKKELQEKSDKLSKAIESIKNIQKSIGKVYYIQEQRLIETRIIPENKRRYRQSEVKYVSVINENSENLKKELAEIMQQHSQLSSKLDGNYIKRLFENNAKVSTDLYNKLTELQKKQKKLQQYGLAEIQNVDYLSNLLKKEEDKLEKFKVELSIYLEDANAKYQVFEPIIDKLELYKKIVNEKLTFKKVYLSSTDGIVVKSEEGKQLSLSDLSSGEKEIIVLFYK